MSQHSVSSSAYMLSGCCAGLARCIQPNYVKRPSDFSIREDVQLQEVHKAPAQPSCDMASCHVTWHVPAHCASRRQGCHKCPYCCEFNKSGGKALHTATTLPQLMVATYTQQITSNLLSACWLHVSQRMLSEFHVRASPQCMQLLV